MRINLDLNESDGVDVTRTVIGPDSLKLFELFNAELEAEGTFASDLGGHESLLFDHAGALPLRLDFLDEDDNPVASLDIEPSKEFLMPPPVSAAKFTLGNPDRLPAPVKVFAL